MNITEIIPSDLSGFCDIETGECVVAETGTPPSPQTGDGNTSATCRPLRTHTIASNDRPLGADEQRVRR